MNVVKCVLAVSLGLVLGTSQAAASLRGSPNLAQLTATADAIVVATVADGAATRAASHSVNLTLLVERVLKGSAQGGTGLTAVWTPKETPPALTVEKLSGTRGLFFASRAPTGQWQLISVTGREDFTGMYFPVAPGAVDTRYAYAAGAPSLEKVLLELGAALARATPLEKTSLQFLHWTPMDKSLDPVAQRIYNNWAGSADENVRMFGLSGLVRQGSGAALALAAQTVQKLGNNSPQLWVLVMAVRDYFRGGSPADLSALAELTAGSPLDMRRAAAYALAAIHSRNSLPFLASLLNSDDAEIRASAVGGLGMFANNLPIVTMAGYRKTGMQPQAGVAPYRTEDTIRHFTMGAGNMQSKEPYYLDFWKDWWKRKRG